MFCGLLHIKVCNRHHEDTKIFVWHNCLEEIGPFIPDFHLYNSKNPSIFVSSIYNFTFMKRTKNKTGKEGNEIVPQEKKSKIALYWEKKPSEGTIINMRAVLK